MDLGDARGLDYLHDVDLTELFIVSQFNYVSESGRETDECWAEKTTHHKCGRCWRHLPEVTEDGALCSRCDQVVAGMDAAHV